MELYWVIFGDEKFLSFLNRDLKWIGIRDFDCYLLFVN